MLCLLRNGGAARCTCFRLIFKPTWRYRNAAMPGENRVNLRHIDAGDGPAESSQVFRHLGRFAKADERRAYHRIAQGPAQRELRQSLAVFCREALEIIDGTEVAGKVLGPEQSAEQVEIAEHAAARAPVTLLELYARVKGAAQHAVGERSVGHDADLLGGAVRENLGLHAPIEHVPAILH